MHLCLYMQRAYHLPLTEILTVLSHYFTEFLVKKTTLILTATSSLASLHLSPFHSCYHESISSRPSIIPSFCISIWSLQNFLFTCSASLPTYKLEGVLSSIQTSFLWLPLLLNLLSKIFLSLFGPLCKHLMHSTLFHLLESFLVLSVSLSMSLLMQLYVNLLNLFQETDLLTVYKLKPAFITTRPILDTLSSKNWHQLPILPLTSSLKNLSISKVLLRPSFLPV